MRIITRFPPSPTGNLHIGGARTALFNFLFTRHHGGKMYLRLENTDEERSKPEYEENILESLQWLRLSFDSLPDGKPFWRQSERKEIYRNHLKKLVENGSAYISKESPASHTPLNPPSKEGGRKVGKAGGVSTTPTPHFSEKVGGTPFRKGDRAEVIRFKNPNKKIVFDDLIRGRIEFDTTELGDMVIAKSLHEPLYHLAVVIDDHEMGITHVIRGEDHISNTPRQILLQEALGFTQPEYAHIPLILAPDRSKLSKRHGAVSVTEYRDRGYFPQAFINYLALLGWNPGPACRDARGAGRTEQELFSIDKLIRLFDLSKIQKGGAMFNEEKLRWMNKEYLKKLMTPHKLISHIPEELVKGRGDMQKNALAETLFERISVIGDMKTDMEKGEFDYLRRKPTYERLLLHWKNAREEDIKKNLNAVSEILNKQEEMRFTRERIQEALMSYAERVGKGIVLWPMRVALSGKDKSPDPFTLAAILGKKEALHRLKSAINMLS